MKVFGERLRELRLEKELSMGELAKQIGTTQQSISRWESGNTIPSGETIVMLSKFFSVTAGYLLGIEN